MLQHHPSHDSCSPDLVHDLEVVGEPVPEHLRHSHAHEHDHKAQPPRKIKPFIQATIFNCETHIVALSRHIPVLVLLGGPLDPGVTRTRRFLSDAAQQAAGQWVFAWVDADSDPEVIKQFRPDSLPCLYAVADETAIGNTTLENSDQVSTWVDNALTHAMSRLPGLPEGTTVDDPGADHQSEIDEARTRMESYEPELQEAAIAVAEGEYGTALAIYEHLLDSTPTSLHPMLHRAHAAVSVLERSRVAAPVQDPVRLADENPEDYHLALRAADAEVLLDEQEGALRRLLPYASIPEVRSRMMELIRLLPEDSSLTAEVRRSVASALFA